jgi:hypothetical protein
MFLSPSPKLLSNIGGVFSGERFRPHINSPTWAAEHIRNELIETENYARARTFLTLAAYHGDHAARQSRSTRRKTPTSTPSEVSRSPQGTLRGRYCSPKPAKMGLYSDI